ncbi:hypothetical protein E4U10_005078 [Claviceps purpurea]|nr:hypothetical protein E4U10_005078 [Claviceps purpurea]
MAPLTRKRKTLNRDNEPDVENAVENDHEESSPIPPANTSAGRSRQPKRPQRTRNVTSVAKPSNVKISKKGNTQTRANTLAAKRSVERMAGELKNYVETELCCTSQTEESPLLDLVMSADLSANASSLFPYLGSAGPDDKAAMKLPNETYKSAMRLLAKYRAAAREYGQLSERSGIAKMPTWLRWEKDSAELEELNTRMLAIATSFVWQQVVPGATEAQPDLGQDDVEQIAWELLEDAHAQQGAETWGNIAETMMQNMRGIMALLP